MKNLKNNKFINSSHYRQLLNSLELASAKILNYLVFKCIDKPFCYPTQKQISQETNLSESTVKRHIKKLQEVRVVNMPIIKTIKNNRIKKKGVWANNIYIINFLVNPDTYLIEGNKEYLKEIIEEYSKLVEDQFNSTYNLQDELEQDYKKSKMSDEEKLLEEGIENFKIDKKDNQLIPLKCFKSDSKKQIIKNIDRISKAFRMSSNDVLGLLTNVGEAIESKTVNHLDNYIHKTVNNFVKISKLEETIGVIYDSLKIDDIFDGVLQYCRPM